MKIAAAVYTCCSLNLIQ